MPKKPDIPEALRGYVADVGRPVTSSDVDTYGKLRNILDESHRVRTIVNAWKAQQTQDRNMRRKYATILLWAMGVQSVIINSVFFLIGFDRMKVDPWTARTFIRAVFAEIASMVFFIVKYLFRPSTDTVLELVRPPHTSEPTRGTHGH
jgi:hypothetical protein